MSSESVNINSELPSYNGLARPAMIMGMPMVPVVITMVGPLFVTMLLLPLIQAKAFAIWLIALPVLAFIKTVSKTDEQALRIISLQVFCLLKRRNYFSFGKTNTILSTRFGRQKNDYIRFFE